MGVIADALRRGALQWNRDAGIGELTEADVAMMRHAMQAGGVEGDFSALYLDEDED